MTPIIVGNSLVSGELETSGELVISTGTPVVISPVVVSPGIVTVISSAPTLGSIGNGFSKSF